MKLLSRPNTNAKTAKNETRTYTLYMSPYTLNSKGVNVCPKASEGCAAACLNTAGMGKFSNVQKARIAKTDFWVSDKKGFYTQLAKEIRNAVKYGEKNGIDIAFRLNGTSDVPHMKMLKSFAGFDINETPDSVIFYDYTKIPQKAFKYRDSKKYRVTFSRSESNEIECIDALHNGVNVAAVFANELPKTWKGFPVVDGDKDDERFKDARGVVVGLLAKGDAKKDTSGFVIR